MGLDGGTIISRTDVLRGASWRVASTDEQHRSSRGGQVSTGYVAQQESGSAAEVAAAKWSSCALTGERLQEPVVADDLGKLYNRESVVQLLLARNGVFAEDAAKYRYENQLHFLVNFEHLRSLKNVFILKPQYAIESGEKFGATVSKQESNSIQKDGNFVCPITAVEACGAHPFAALRPCGHCFSCRALREVKDACCPLCSTPYALEEVVVLNPPESQIRELREKLRRTKKVRDVKGQKRKRSDDAIVGSSSEPAQAQQPTPVQNGCE